MRRSQGRNPQLPMRLAFFLPLLALSVLAQAQSLPRLHTEGLRRTHPAYLATQLDELTYVRGDTTLAFAPDVTALDSAFLGAFRQNLLNLPPIQGAELRFDTTAAGEVRLVAELREARTRFPVLGFGGVRGNVNFELGAMDVHGFGRGRELTAAYRNNGGEHGFLLRYVDPAVNNSRYGLEVEAQRYAAVEPVFFARRTLDYDYVNEGAGVVGRYRLRQRHTVGLGVTLFRETFTRLDHDAEIAGAPLELQQDKQLFKLEHVLDRRDYLDERIGGHDQRTFAQVVTTAGDRAFAIAWHEARHYWLVGARGNLALRGRLGLSSNRDSPFAPFTLDAQLNIRGSGNRADRGTAQAILKAEYRHRVWADRKGDLKVQAVAFSDLGAWRSPGGDFRELADPQTLQHFVGGGLRLVSAKAKNSVLRIDYGVDWRTPARRGFVFGVGQYF